MFGAIVGDIAGSAYERRGVPSKDFDLFPLGCRFTDDTVLTVAIADALITRRSYDVTIREYAKKNPYRGYGHRFFDWMGQPNAPAYNSFGNGSAMRVSPVAWYRQTLNEVEDEAIATAMPTHNHPEGIKGAKATAGAIFLARRGSSKADIRAYLENLGYLIRPLEEIKSSGYRFDSSCQGSVPEAMSAFLESTGYEDAIRNAISLNGDTDTQAAIAGSVAEAFYGGVPQSLKDKAMEYFVPSITPIALEFDAKYVVPSLQK